MKKQVTSENVNDSREYIVSALLCQYAEENGWKTFPRKPIDYRVYQYENENNEEEFLQIIIPLNKNLVDYGLQMEDAMMKIAKVKGVSLFEFSQLFDRYVRDHAQNCFYVPTFAEEIRNPELCKNRKYIFVECVNGNLSLKGLFDDKKQAFIKLCKQVADTYNYYFHAPEESSPLKWFTITKAVIKDGEWKAPHGDFFVKNFVAKGTIDGHAYSWKVFEIDKFIIK